MKRFVKKLLYIIISIVMMSVACTQNQSTTDDKEFQSAMTELKTELESGLSYQREEPFEVRSFKPYIDDKWIGNAVAYGCYRAGQAPGVKGPSDAELLEDLNIITKHWNLIRVYGADDDTKRILQLINKHKLPIKVIQGIWLEPEETNPEKKKSNIEQVMLGIELAKKYPDIVAAICVANETQVFWSGHKMKLENLIHYTRVVRSNVAVPVTTADDYLYWNLPESKQLADEMDFVFSHIHPLWNGQTLDGAIGWMDKIYHELQDMHPKRLIVIGETGWATDYNAAKKGDGEQGTLIKGEVGLEAQAKFLIELKQWIDSSMVTTFLFEAFDESWKGGGESSPPNEVEKHWGVYNEDRTPKESFLEYLDQ